MTKILHICQCNIAFFPFIHSSIYSSIMSRWERCKICFTRCFNHTASLHTKYVLKKIKACFQDMIDSALSPSPISPHMHQSNDLCLITGYKRRASSDRLHIRSQIFIINPSPHMKVMAVPSLVRDPRRSRCLLTAASLAAAFPNMPAVRGNWSSLMEGREEVDLEGLSIYDARAEKKQHQSGREAKTCDQR